MANENVEVKALPAEINGAKADHSVASANIGHAQEMMWQDDNTTPSSQENERCLCTDDK